MLCLSPTSAQCVFIQEFYRFPLQALQSPIGCRNVLLGPPVHHLGRKCAREANEIDTLRAQVAQLARRLDEASARGAAGAGASSNQGPGPKA